MTATTLTLADFILARVAEDEAAAQRRQALLDSLPDYERAAAETVRASLLGGPSWHVPLGAPDPTRLLAESESRRAIVEAARDYSPELEHGDNGEWAFDEVLRLLAKPYADHPDFDPAWL